MIGTRNVVFGFLFLALSAALGPYMVVRLLPEVDKAAQQRQQHMAELQLLASNDFEKDLEPVPGDELARTNSTALLALNRFLQQRQIVDGIKGGPHAHGNLESLLNIAVGLTLAFLTVPALLKQLISWCFILGTLLHSGMLYLAVVFEQAWAGSVLATGIGPLLILAGLVLTGVAAAIGFGKARTGGAEA